MSAPGELVADFDYELPEALIAQHPAEQRVASRLLVLERETGRIEHTYFGEIGRFLGSGDCLVLNDTRVIPARLLGALPTGGRVELLLLSDLGEGVWECLGRPAGKLRAGRLLRFGEGPTIEAEVLSRGEEPGSLHVRLTSGVPLLEALDAVGHVPLPPYIRRPDAAADRERYQTVFARVPGSAAAPTAGLHFDEPLLDSLAEQGVTIARVTLHVGLGTFRPMAVGRIAEHRMHEERYLVPPSSVRAIEETRHRGGRVVAVGTTAVRTLETVAADGFARTEGATGLFIRPGHRFLAVDAMVTNFHLPRSTLLVLVSAFAGRERVLEAYREAVREGYRFFSYGDAMLLV